MARLYGKDVAVSVDNSSGTPVIMTSETTAISIEPGGDVHETTTMGDSWDEFTAGLKRGGDVIHELFFEDTATTGVWAVYVARLLVTGTLSITMGARSISCETIVTKLSPPMDVGNMVKFTATHKVTGAVTFS